MTVRFALPPSEEDWRREAQGELHACLDAGLCAARLLAGLVETPTTRALVHAVSLALRRARVAARRAAG